MNTDTTIDTHDTPSGRDERVVADRPHDDRPDLRDLFVVHQVFRREFRLLPEMVRCTRPGDTDRTDRVAGWVIDMAEFLDHHHHGEDELVWPKLRERVGVDRSLVDRMETQHQEVERVLHPITRLATVWREVPTAANRDVLAIALEAIPPVLFDHLDLEEAEVVPLIERHLTAAEWAEVGERGRAAIPPAKLLTVLGAFLEDATPEQRTLMLSGLPVAAKAAWTLVGRHQYARSMRRLRSGR